MHIFFDENKGIVRRRRWRVPKPDVSLVILLAVGLLVAGVTVPIANSPDSYALCFAPVVTMILLYSGVRYFVGWSRL